MKTYKQIDFFVQTIAIIAGVIFSVMALGGALPVRDYEMIYSYFVVGALQILSCLIHLFFVQSQYKSTGRKGYHITLLVIIFCLAITYPFEALIFTGLGLLFVSPIMAVLYCWMCFKELKLFTHETEQLRTHL